MRLIDADTFLSSMIKRFHRVPLIGRNDYDCDSLKQMLAEAPTVDAAPVVYGHWISDEADVLFHCSECDTQISTSWDYDDLHWNYCPNCGAKMDGERKDNESTDH